MMRTKNISTFISSLAISLLLFTQAAHAQSARKVIAELQRDTIPFFRGFAVSADLIGPLEYALSDYGQFEASLRINLKDKYFPTIEVGLGKADRSDDITLMEYKTSAPFGRIGCDFNIMKDKHDIYRILVGARYAFTSFKYDLYHPDITDPEYRTKWKERYKEIIRSLRSHYPKARFIMLLTVLMHYPTWDDALDEIVEELGDERLTHFRFKRCGAATPGHPRLPEQYEMASELTAYITRLENVWE